MRSTPQRGMSCILSSILSTLMYRAHRAVSHKMICQCACVAVLSLCCSACCLNVLSSALPNCLLCHLSALQSVLRNIEKQIQDFQRQQQQRDLASELEHHHKLPVDIQIVDQVGTQ